MTLQRISIEEVYQMKLSGTASNDIAKKKYKRTNNDLQNIHIKLKIE